MLSLTLHRPPELPVDCRGWLPSSEQTTASLLRQPLLHGNQQVEAGDFFRIERGAVDPHWRLEGDLSRFHHLGQRMAAGRITVHGDVGRHAGAGMQDGELHVTGNAGDRLAASMSGGRVQVDGDAGDFVAACYPGEAVGMRDGEVIVHGSVGDCLGAGMRRGLVVVGGRSGRLAGNRMVAGILLVLGECGDSPGLGMRRGTLGLFGKNRPALPPAFGRSCRIDLPSLRLVKTRVHEVAGENLASGVPRDVELYNGDLLGGARGELLLRAPP